MWPPLKVPPPSPVSTLRLKSDGTSAPERPLMISSGVFYQQQVADVVGAVDHAVDGAIGAKDTYLQRHLAVDQRIVEVDLAADQPWL
jgi:hypothetical protein